MNARLSAVLIAIASIAPIAVAEDRLLHLYNWESYMTAEVIDLFRQETGIKVKEDYFASNEELIAKIQAGAFDYDLAVPSDHYVHVLIQQNLLAPLDRTLLTNLPNLETRFLDPPYDRGNRYSVPYFWGTTGIGYNREKISAPVDSWKILFDPKWKRKINLLDDFREVIGISLRLAGHSINSTKGTSLSEVRAQVLAQKDVVRTYNSSTYREILAAGDVWLTQAYSGDIIKLRMENPAIDFVNPKEGGTLFTDTLVIPARSKRKADVHRFINFLLRPDIALKLAMALGFPTPNREAKALLPDKVRNDPAIYPPDAIFSKLEYIEDVGSALPFYEGLWIDLKTR